MPGYDPSINSEYVFNLEFDSLVNNDLTDVHQEIIAKIASILRGENVMLSEEERKEIRLEPLKSVLKLDKNPAVHNRIIVSLTISAYTRLLDDLRVNAEQFERLSQIQIDDAALNEQVQARKERVDALSSRIAMCEEVLVKLNASEINIRENIGILADYKAYRREANADKDLLQELEVVVGSQIALSKARIEAIDERIAEIVRDEASDELSEDNIDAPVVNDGDGGPEVLSDGVDADAELNRMMAEMNGSALDVQSSREVSAEVGEFLARLKLMLKIVKNYAEIENDMESLGIQYEVNKNYQKIHDYLDLRKQSLESSLHLGGVDLDTVMREIGEFRANFEDEFKDIDYRLEAIEHGVEVPAEISSANIPGQSLEELLGELTTSSTAPLSSGAQSGLSPEAYVKSKHQLAYLIDQDIMYLNKIKLYINSDSAIEVRKLLEGVYDINRKYFIQKNYQTKNSAEAVKLGDLESRQQALEKELIRAGIIAPEIKNAEPSKYELENQIKKLTSHIVAFDACLNRAYSKSADFEEDKVNLRKIYQDLCRERKALVDSGLDEKQQSVIAGAERIIREYDHVNFSNKNDLYTKHLLIGRTKINLQYFENLKIILSEASDESLLSLAANNYPVEFKKARDLLVLNVRDLTALSGKLKDGDFKNYIDSYLVNVKNTLDDYNKHTKLYADRMTGKLEEIINELRGYLSDADHNLAYTGQFKKDIELLQSIIMEHRSNHYLNFNQHSEVKRIAESIKNANQNLEKYKQLQNLASRLSSQAQDGIQEEVKYLTPDIADQSKQQQAILMGTVQETKEKKASIADELKQEISKIQAVEISADTKNALESFTSAVTSKLNDSREQVSAIPGANRLAQQYSNIEMLLVRMTTTFGGASKWGLLGHEEISKLSTEMDDVIKIIDLLQKNAFKTNVELPYVDMALYGEIKNIMKRVNLYRVDQDHVNTIDAHQNKLLIFEEFLKSRNAKVAQKVKSAKFKLEKDLSEKKYGKLETTREQVLPKLEVSDEQKPFQFKSPEAASEAYHQVLIEMKAISQQRLDGTIEPGLDDKFERLDALVSWLPKIKNYTVAVADLLKLIARDLTSDISDVNKAYLLNLKESLDKQTRLDFADPIVATTIDIIVNEYASIIQSELIAARDHNPLTYIARFNRLTEAVNALSPDTSLLVLGSLQPVIEEHQDNPIIRDGVIQKDIRERLNEIINTDQSKFLGYINQWANFEIKKGEYKGRYDDVAATFEGAYSAEKKAHDKFIGVMKQRVDDVVKRAVQMKAVLDGNSEIDSMFHLDIEDLFQDMQYLNDDISHISELHKELMEKADIGPESSRRQLSDFAVSLNGLMQKIPMQELNQLKSQIEIEREYVSLLSSASDDLNLTADIFNNVAASKQFHKKFMANAATLSPAYFFAPQQFNQDTLTAIKANHASQLQLAYYLQQIPIEFWRGKPVNVEAVMDRLSDERPLLNEILKIVDLVAYQQSIASSDKVYQAINEIDETFRRVDLTQYIVDNFVAKLKDVDGVVDEVTIMELEFFLKNIPEDCYKTDKEGTIQKIIEMANDGKLDAKFLAARLHPKKYSEHLFQLIDAQLSTVTNLSGLKLKSCRDHLSVIEGRITEIPALQASVDGRQLLAEISEQQELLRYHVKINTYATTPQSLQAMSEAVTKIQLKISELSTRVEDYLQTHKSLVTQQAVTPPKSSKKLAQTSMLEGMLQMRTPQTKPHKKPDEIVRTPPPVPTAPLPANNVPSNDPIIQHLLKWGDKEFALGRAFMISSTNADPTLDKNLHDIFINDGKSLIQLLNRPIATESDVTQLNHDIHQFFVERAAHVNASLNAHPHFKDRTFEFKQNIYNSYISAMKSETLKLINPPSLAQRQLSSQLIDLNTPQNQKRPSSFPLENIVPIIDNSEISKFKSSQTMHHLIDMISKMELDYKTLGKSKHSNEMLKLCSKLADKNMTLEGAIKLVQAEFDRQRQSAKSLFGISFSRQSFADVINKEQKHYHYPRMLAIALEAAYRENALHIPKSLQTNRLTSQVKVPDSEYYQKYKAEVEERPQVSHRGREN